VPGIEPLNLRISGGSYQSGDNASDAGFYSGFYDGALHAHGVGRKIVVLENTSIQNNPPLTAIPKGSAALGATIVIRDANPATPFDGLFDDPNNVGGTGTVIECSDYDGVPVTVPPEPSPPPECQ
jgi:hypothetical protein